MPGSVSSSSGLEGSRSSFWRSWAISTRTNWASALVSVPQTAVMIWRWVTTWPAWPARMRSSWYSRGVSRTSSPWIITRRAGKLISSSPNWKRGWAEKRRSRPRITARIRASSSPTPTGLFTKSSAPRSSAAIFSLSRSRAESTMIGASDHSRMRWITSLPSMSGRPRSRITSSDGSLASCASAASPLSAVETVKPAAASAGVNARRICGSSSTIRSRPRFAVIYSALHSGARSRQGQRHDQSTRAIGAQNRARLAPHALHDAADDGEPQSGAGHALGRRAAIELVEEVGELGFRHARPLVGHLHHDLAVLDEAHQLDRPAVGRIADGVLQHIGQRHLEQHRVAQRHARALAQLAADPALAPQPLEPLARAVDHLGQVEGGAGGIERAGFQAGHVQEVGDECVQPLGLLLDGGRQVVPGLGVELVAELLQRGRRGQHRGQRGSEVVAD